MLDLEQLVINASIILWACDLKGIITLQIGGNLERLNITQNFSVGVSIYEAMKGTDGFFEALNIAINKREKVECLYKFNGNYCQARICPTEDGIIGVCSLETDKIMQDKINLVNLKIEDTNINKNKVNNHIAVISHEIRTPLNGILGILNLIKNDVPDLSYIDMIQKYIDTLLDLLDDFLDFSKIENGKMIIEDKRFNLYEMVNEIIIFFSPSASKKNIEIKSNVSTLNKNTFYISDPKRIIQILNNLLSNAIKFTPENGNVNIEICNFEDSFDIRIIDSGKGVSYENQPKLFKPYSQINNTSGTGLGLSICKHLIKLMNGTIGYNNKPSTFWIKIKIKQDFEITLKQDVNIGIIPKVNIINKRILIAEDDKINNLILCKYIYKLGFLDVISTKNGKEAFQVLKESIEKNNRFSYVLLDNKMPYLTGIDICDKFSSLKTIEKMILVSGDTEIKENFSGIDAIILKPYDIAQIRIELEQI